MFYSNKLKVGLTHNLVKYDINKFITIELILKKFIENKIKWQLYVRRQNNKQDAFNDVLSDIVTPFEITHWPSLNSNETYTWPKPSR